MNVRDHVKKFLADYEKESVLATIDWREELLLAIEAGDCCAAINAQQKSGIKVSREVVENLLLQALCLGKVIDSYRAAVWLNRDLSETEVMILTEVAMLTGNMTGMCILAHTRRNQDIRAFLHCTMVIAVARDIKLKNRQILPPYGVTGTWMTLYKREISQLGITGKLFYTKKFPSGKFLILQEKSKQRLLGYLLAHELISQEDSSMLDR